MATVTENSLTLACQVNGADVEVQLPADDELTLLDVLRDYLGITSPKNGCQPQAQCGCCTILMDDKPVLSCAIKPVKAAGKSITTLEGLDEQHRQQIADSFVQCGGVQCGFCIPGMAMRGVGLCDKNPEPSREEIATALKPHLCRCTGYTQIVDSIEQYAKLRRGEKLPEPTAADLSGKVGTNLPRFTGHDAVLGDRKFIDDMTVPDMLYGAVRLTDHPRAKILSIDASRALDLAGVHRVVTAADVPGDPLVGLIAKDWPVFVGIGDVTRCTGDVIAGVVAENQRLARRAAELIDIEYEVLEPVTSPRAALEPDAPRVHPHLESNLLSKSSLKRGDIEEGFRNSAFIIEDSYVTQRIEHLFLEPEACLVIPTDERAGRSPAPTGSPNGAPTGVEDDPARSLFVYTQGQGVFDDQRQISSVLGIDPSRVQVELVSNGGAFGGKEDMSIQAQTALMAWLVGRPVKLTLTRPESFRIHPKRHPIELDYKVGCDSEGHITAVQARIIGDKGAYASVGAKVLERAGGHCTGPYRVPAVDMESLAVYTNNPPCGAMRGFGANQAAFAIEGLLDRLAEKVGIDAYDMRDRNILEPGEAFATGQILDKPFGLRKTLEAVREIYKSAPYAGIACGIKNVGIGNGMPDIGRAALTVEDEGTIHIRTGFTEMGQGLFTLCIQFAVEATGLPPEYFTVSTDTTLQLDCGQTTASRATVLAGNSIAAAGEMLKNALDGGKTLSQLVGQVYQGEWVCDYTSKLGYHVDKPGGPKTHLTYGFATQVAILDENGRLAKMVAAHDVGRVLNPVQLEGQMYGSLHMGIGYALTEDFQSDGGVIQAKKMNDCGVLRSHQMPEMELIFVEEPDPECPFGARGVGEIGLVPTAPAIAGALYKYDGVVRRSLPMSDSPAALAITKPQAMRNGRAK
ncbi:molybdopterin cofactor-binding domain-containing protein [Bythopirellula goksoeyrii]|uniref:Aldehyde oxidoreductase n=1 Tax=Bythopirellula goksoeyrii TaxID=1400387 RepID=A0A5B9QT18_9BACT|nr:molybdopterin cofactor-binding domain-containing protein [Bythopirellula goksoeyrii]QEG37251.1 Aldehyde oxidoreductase [Bythopirellula goksoeyrii]